MQDLTRLNLLINKAASIYGSDNQLAQALGTSRQTVSNWRHGIKSPGIDVQQKMAEIASEPVEYTVAMAAVEKTGNAQAIQWLESQLKKIRTLYLTTRFFSPKVERIRINNPQYC